MLPATSELLLRVDAVTKELSSVNEFPVKVTEPDSADVFGLGVIDCWSLMILVLLTNTMVSPLMSTLPASPVNVAAGRGLQNRTH